jgi:type IV secretory pathway VirB4 component
MRAADSHISYFARTTSRAPHYRFGMRQVDRLSHTHVIGVRGVGKTSLLQFLAEGALLVATERVQAA